MQSLVPSLVPTSTCALFLYRALLICCDHGTDMPTAADKTCPRLLTRHARGC